MTTGLTLKNKVTMDNLAPVEVTIPICIGPNLFVRKYAYWEGEPSCADKGKDLGFTLVFGNFGEKDQPGVLVNDVLTIPAGAGLQVMSTSLADNFVLTYIAPGSTTESILTPASPILTAGITDATYTINVRNRTSTGFDIIPLIIPKHTVYCISILFQIE